MIAPQYGFAYLMRPRGGIDAVDLASGAVRWRSDSAARPLALAGDRTVQISLPAGIAATVVDTPAGSFRVRADVSGSELAVSWESTATATAQGYLPAENEGQAPTFVAGAAVLDLSSPTLRLKAEPAVRVARSAALARVSLEELRTPAVAGTGGRQLLSADGRHVLVTEPMDAAERMLYRHRWTVYERESGARLGSVQALVSATPFLVVGKTLYHMSPAHAVRQESKVVEHPFALRAVNLATGAEVWTKAAGETAFRGPFPP
jgi:hypothetical protein